MHRSPDPRWGVDDRDLKGRAILNVLKRVVGDSVLNGNWLDIGCGSGGISAELSIQANYVTGIDPEPWQRWDDYQRDRLNLTFKKMGYQEMEALLGECSMDVVICNQVYEHVDNPDALLQQIYRVLKPGGCCYFAGPNLWWPIEPHVHWAFVHWLPRKFAIGLMKTLRSNRTNDLDAWSWSWFKLVKAFRRNEFEYSNILLDRVLSDVGPSASSFTFKVAAKVPRAATNLLAPIMPAFVFLLRKNSQ